MPIHIEPAAIDGWLVAAHQSGRSALTRRAFLQALLVAIAILFRPLATRFTKIADELARLTCWRSPEFERGLQPA